MARLLLVLLHVAPHGDHVPGAELRGSCAHWTGCRPAVGGSPHTRANVGVCVAPAPAHAVSGTAPSHGSAAVTLRAPGHLHEPPTHPYKHLSPRHGKDPSRRCHHPPAPPSHAGGRPEHPGTDLGPPSRSCPLSRHLLRPPPSSTSCGDPWENRPGGEWGPGRRGSQEAWVHRPARNIVGPRGHLAGWH